MDLGHDRYAASHFTGMGLVLVIHALLAWGLLTGLARRAADLVTGPVEARLIEEPKPPPPPPEKVIPPPPETRLPQPIFVPPPEFKVTAPAPPAVLQSMTSPVPPARIEMQPQPPAPAPAPPPPVVVAAPAPKPAKVTAGMVCTTMGKPELPPVTWGGEALFRAAATVRNGRVVMVDVTSLRGGIERRAQRALMAAVETALRDTYICPGDHEFEQEFLFRVE